jgi:hypothetical protein
MAELSVVPLSAVILALVLAVDGYNKAREGSANKGTVNNFLTVIVALAIFILVAVLALLFKPTSSAVKMLFSVVSLVALLVALVVSWLNYVNNTGSALGAQTLVIALVAAIPLLASVMTRETLTLSLNM